MLNILKKYLECHYYCASPLHCTAMSGDINAVVFLIEKVQNFEHKVDLNLPDVSGYFPLERAIQNHRKQGCKDVSKYLIEHGVDFKNTPDWTGRTPLHMAIHFGCRDIAKFLKAVLNLMIHPIPHHPH